MRFSLKVISSLLLTIAAVSTTSLFAQATPAADKSLPAELAVDYTYMRSNAPPGDCGCFNLNGGSATFGWRIGQSHFALVGDVSVVEAGKISSNGYGLTLSAFTFGARYQFRLGHSPLHPFGQILAGVVHGSGSLVDGQNPAVSNSGGTFAGNAGGGIDLNLTHRLSIRMVEADYLATTFNNGENDHQNNLRLSSGAVFHF
jgi:peptidoglycan-associated lipoprotein